MAMKCSHNNFGFCKFREECRYPHPVEICRKTSCQRRDCQKRHPKPCRNYFLMKICRFGHKCKYAHFYDCEICENLSHLVQKEAKEYEENFKKKDKDIERMAQHIKSLKIEKADLEKKVKVLHNQNEELIIEVRKQNEETKKFKDSNRVLQKANEGLVKLA